MFYVRPLCALAVVGLLAGCGGSHEGLRLHRAPRRRRGAASTDRCRRAATRRCLSVTLPGRRRLRVVEDGGRTGGWTGVVLAESIASYRGVPIRVLGLVVGCGASACLSCASGDRWAGLYLRVRAFYGRGRVTGRARAREPDRLDLSAGLSGSPVESGRRLVRGSCLSHRPPWIATVPTRGCRRNGLGFVCLVAIAAGLVS